MIQYFTHMAHSALRTLIVALLLSSLPASGQAQPDAARQKQLVNLVRQDCGSCHGMTLKGGLGKALLPGELRDLATSSLASIILDGIPDTPMPPWRGLLQEDEALWIARQLKKGFPQ